jgi:hypothetical protein
MHVFLTTYACDVSCYVHLLVGTVTTNSVLLCDLAIKKGYRNQHSFHGP